MEYSFTTKARALRALGREVQDLIEAGFLIRVELAGGNGEYEEGTIRLSVFEDDRTVRGRWHETHFYRWL